MQVGINEALGNAPSNEGEVVGSDGLREEGDTEARQESLMNESVMSESPVFTVCCAVGGKWDVAILGSIVDQRGTTLVQDIDLRERQGERRDFVLMLTILIMI